MIEDIRKRHEERKKSLERELGKPCPLYFGSLLTISDVDALFAALDEAMKESAILREKLKAVKSE